jgi:predicted PolB exonuclease-like 3'-5' exonuclease
MLDHVLVFDLETVPDLAAAARVHGLSEGADAEAREALGDKFPKAPLHKIAVIGCLIAARAEAGWQVRGLGAPHIGQRSEPELIASFVDKIDELRPRLVSFNGSGFDLPVLRYRAMLHLIPAPGLSGRSYFHRFSGDAIDLCDVLSSFGASSKCKLNEVCRALGLPGKTEGMDGSKVEEAIAQGRIEEVALYCLDDVIATYRLWLTHEVFCGRLTRTEFDKSEIDLTEAIARHESRSLRQVA